MSQALSDREFVHLRNRLRRVGAALHRSHPLDGPALLFVTVEHQTRMVTPDGIASLVAHLEGSTIGAWAHSYGKAAGGARA